MTSSSGDSKTGPILAPGDMVEVCEGQLMHLQGKVINVEGDVITIMPKHDDLKVLYMLTYIPAYTVYYCIVEKFGGKTVLQIMYNAPN